MDDVLAFQQLHKLINTEINIPDYGAQSASSYVSACMHWDSDASPIRMLQLDMAAALVVYSKAYLLKRVQ